MPFKGLKITTRLTICTAVFLLPLGIMLYSIISVSLVSIRKDQNELKGLEVLNPAMSLLYYVPQYINVVVDRTGGDREKLKNDISDFLEELDGKYNQYFGEEAIVVSPSGSWDYITSSEIRENILWTYTQLMRELCRMIVYIGDISGLVTDSELESAYLIAASIHDIPQAQERLVSISYLLRAMETGELTIKRKEELALNIELLIYSDNSRIQNRINASEVLGIRNIETSDVFKNLMNTFYGSIKHYADAVEHVINAPAAEKQNISVLNDIAAHAHINAYRLQNASVERLETLIKSRIKARQLNLTLSVIFSVFAAAAAFVIVFITMAGFRRSTRMVRNVFSELSKNKLSVQVEVTTQDEFGELLMSFGQFLERLKAAFNQFNNSADMISTAVYDLSASTKQISSTANEQSASVAEIVNTMENNKNLSEQAAAKTFEVAELALETENLSQRGADLHNANEVMMGEIKDQNAKIVDEIKNLSDILSRIDESVQLIDTIADRTKLIAFNAALEASSSGEAGLRFAVVAGEIRRFADNVVESVLEIKDRISDLQSASDALISEADIGARAISLGYNRMVEQKEVFNNIVDVSQNVAARSQQISSLSKQQEQASAQIFTTLKEISAGVKQFVSATVSTSSTTENLNRISRELKEILEKYQTKKKGNV